MSYTTRELNHIAKLHHLAEVIDPNILVLQGINKLDHTSDARWESIYCKSVDKLVAAGYTMHKSGPNHLLSCVEVDVGLINYPTIAVHTNSWFNRDGVYTDDVKVFSATSAFAVLQKFNRWSDYCITTNTRISATSYFGDLPYRPATYPGDYQRLIEGDVDELVNKCNTMSLRTALLDLAAMERSLGPAVVSYSTGLNIPTPIFSLALAVCYGEGVIDQLALLKYRAVKGKVENKVVGITIGRDDKMCTIPSYTVKAIINLIQGSI